MGTSLNRNLETEVHESNYNHENPPPLLPYDAAAGPIAARFAFYADPLFPKHDYSSQKGLVNVSNEDILNIEQRTTDDNTAQVDSYMTRIDELFVKVDHLEKGVNEVEQFYLNAKLKKTNTSKGALIIKGKEKEKHNSSMKRLQQDASSREASVANRMEELMHHFGSIFHKITQHEWAWPFRKPVDVEGLGLHDYYQIIDRPMDFSTIENRMDAKDGTGYTHIREICSDMRLVFKNAMKYNDEKSDTHVMAKKLLENFEEKWLHFLPKVTEEERIREEEESEAQMNTKLAQQEAHAKLARDISNELYNIDSHLEELREMVVNKCRHISTLEKRSIGVALSKCSPEDLNKALEIVAHDNPNFQASADEIDIDINSQSESTLWRLKLFVKDVLVKDKSKSDEDDTTAPDAAHELDDNIISKRKQQIFNALAKSAKRRKKNPPAL